MMTAQALVRALADHLALVFHDQSLTPEQYLEAATAGHKLSRPIKVVAACGNGTAGIVAPEALRRIGAEVIPMDTELDYTFPKYNPNPEDLHMLHAMSAAVKEPQAPTNLSASTPPGRIVR